MSTVSIGQVWRDKDKRRDTTIEIIDTFHSDEHGDMAVGLVVGTEEEREYKVDRLTSRWTLVATKADVSEMIEEKLEEVAEVTVNKKSQPAPPKHKTREQWLVAAVEALTKRVFKPSKFEVPEVRVSVGWPGGRGKKKGVIGQCFATSSTDDKVAQIFVSPVVSDALGALIVVAHELVHAVDDCKSAHKSGFIKIAREIGFTPKWTVATEDVITDEFREKLEAIAEKLGTYPHAAIRPTERPKVQKTYLIKLVCQHDDDMKLRITQKMLDDFGYPLCGCHKQDMIEAE